MATWQLQEAKNRLSQVVDDAIDKGPQVITRHGVEVVVILSYDEYRQILASRLKLGDFFRASPLVGMDIDFSRDQSPIREAFRPDDKE